jgi:hypothetical protein
VLVGDRDAAGFPDLVMVREPKLVFAELKAPRGRLSAEQSAWIGALQLVAPDSAGYDVLVRVWRPADWPEIEQMLGRER